MKYLDPARPRQANGLPTWKDNPGYVLPSLDLFPSKYDHQITVRVMIAGSQASIDMSTDTFVTLLQAWKDDPENALRCWFGREPPEVRPPPTTTLMKPKQQKPEIIEDMDSSDLGF